MSQPNHIQKNGDFKLAIVIRIEGKNGHAMILRFVSLVTTIALIGIKASLLIMAKSP